MEPSDTEAVEVVDGGLVVPPRAFRAPSRGRPGAFSAGVFRADGGLVARGRQMMPSYICRAPASPHGPVASRPVRALFAGVLHRHFGHFMAESLSRLWAAPGLAAELDVLVFFAREPARPVADFARQMIRLIAPDLPIEVMARPTRYERLFVPDQLADAQLSYIHGDERTLRALAPIRSMGGVGPGRLYVSRAGLPLTAGGFTLEREIDALFEAEGYRVLHPERLPLADQIVAYNTAERIVFAEGSAIHLYALLARPGQKVFLVMRRAAASPRPSTFEWQIRAFGNPDVVAHTGLLASWIPARDGVDPVHARVVLDLPALRGRLAACGFVGCGTWPAADEARIREEVERATRANGCPMVLDRPAGRGPNDRGKPRLRTTPAAQ